MLFQLPPDFSLTGSENRGAAGAGPVVGREFPRIPNSVFNHSSSRPSSREFSALGQMSVTFRVRDVTGLVALRAFRRTVRYRIRESFLH